MFNVDEMMTPNVSDIKATKTNIEKNIVNRVKSNGWPVIKYVIIKYVLDITTWIGILESVDAAKYGFNPYHLLKYSRFNS